MSQDRFTPNQLSAIETLDRPVVVTAGPGAGKTLVLVERVLNILKRQAADLSQIVAITFTNKAANEMKAKIRRAFIELARQSTEREEVRRWTEMKRRLDEAVISTIHGFCAKILRAHPVESQVDPEFLILDEYTSNLLLNQAVEETVSDLIETANRIVGRLVIGYSRPGLIAALSDLYTASRTLGLTLEQVAKLTHHHLSTASDYQSAIDELTAQVESLSAMEGLTKKMQQQVDELSRTFNRYSLLLPTEPKIEEAALFDECIAAIREAKVHKKGKIGELATQVESCLDDVELTFYDACAGEVIDAIMEALSRVELRYSELKQESNGLDYEDLQWRTRDLFRAHPHLARAYAYSVKFILVDEFQDTNGLQAEIVNLLTGWSGIETARGPNLFLVGDQRQSIYNFRGAAVEVFAQTEREMTERGGVSIVLDKNFRSTPPLVGFFNEFFSRLMTADSDSDLQVLEQLGYVRFTRGEAHRGASIEAPVELILEVGEHVKDVETGRELEAARVAARIARMVQTGECLIADGVRDSGLVVAGEEVHDPDIALDDSQPPSSEIRPVKYGDIAILLRAMTDIKVYEEALRQRGIPYFVLSGRGFYERQEIQDLLSLLHFLENRTDEIALVSALRSPLFGLSDETLYWLRQQVETRSGGLIEHHAMLTSLFEYETAWGISDGQRPLVARAAEVLARLLEIRNRVRLADLLREILAATGYEAIQATAYDGHQRVANLRKLLELARGFEATGPHFLSDFTRFVRQFTEMETREGEAQLESSAADAVKVMTIHKAKGLEFPVVIIPDLARNFRADFSSLAFDRGLGIGLKVPDLRGRLHDTKLRRRVLDHIGFRELFESQRLLFVAMTRARDYLVLSGAARKLSDKAIDEARCWLDWLCSILQIEEFESLPDVYEWNGVKIKIGAKGADVAGPAGVPLMKRFPELALGQVVPKERLLPLLEADEHLYETILRRAADPPRMLTPTPQAVSVTRLLSLARCPLQFYYETVLGLPPSDEFQAQSLPSGTRPGSVLTPSARGRIVHRFCELYDGSEAWEMLLNRIVSESMVRSGPSQEADAEASPDADLQSAREAALSEVRPLIENYLKSDLYRTVEQIIWKSRPGQVESEVEFVCRTRWMPVRGRIDKLVITEGGEARIVDFKTDRKTAEQLEPLDEEYSLQLRIYALAVQQAMRPKSVRAELYFLDPNVRVPLSDDELEGSRTVAILDELGEAIIRGRSVEDFPAKPEPSRCRRCSCFSFCPEKAVIDSGRVRPYNEDAY